MKVNKLKLNQETLKNLTDASKPQFGTNTKHSCNSVCGLPCTPVAGMN